MNVGPVGNDEIADQGQPFCEKRTIEHHRAGLGEWGPIQLNDARAHRAKTGDRLLKTDGRSLRRHRTSALRAAARRSSYSRPRAESFVRRGNFAQEGIVRIFAGQERKNLGSVGASEGEHRHTIEGTVRVDHPSRADDAGGRLEADDIVERRRHPSRAAGIAAERRARRGRERRPPQSRNSIRRERGRDRRDPTGWTGLRTPTNPVAN